MNESKKPIEEFMQNYLLLPCLLYFHVEQIHTFSSINERLLVGVSHFDRIASLYGCPHQNAWCHPGAAFSGDFPASPPYWSCCRPPDRSFCICRCPALSKCRDRFSFSGWICRFFSCILSSGSVSLQKNGRKTAEKTGLPV